MPTILVTGGAGYIGSHTAFLLAQKGYKVIVLDLLVHQQKFNHEWAHFICDDVGNKQTLDHVFSTYKINAVMHFAAYASVGESVKNPLKYYKNNVVNTTQLLQSMLQHNIKKIIFSSTAAIYGNPQIIPITEDHPTNPINPYGQTKLIIENMLKDLHTAYDLHYITLRYFNAAGALPEHGLYEQHKPETHITPLLLSAAQQNKPFYVFGTDYPTNDGSCIRDYLHVWDLAHAHVSALEHLEHEKPSDIFNLGTGNGISVKEMINAVERICKTKIKIINQEKRPGDPPVLVADPSKAMNILGWQPQYSHIDFILQSAYAALMIPTEKQNSLSGLH